jgi:putative glutamine amidotransferase
LVDRLDGLMFTGGGDMEITRFGGAVHPKVKGVDAGRDQFEFDLIQSALEIGRPILGICRGFQLLNVALGGTLYTHLADQFPNAIKHDYDSGAERELLAHPVSIQSGTRLAGLAGQTSLQVNSLHHQGVRELASRLQPVAFAPDGLVEGVELRDGPFGLAVQWHPEWLLEQTASRRLFQSLIDAAATWRRDR